MIRRVVPSSVIANAADVENSTAQHYAAVSVANAQLYTSTAAMAGQSQEATATRDVFDAWYYTPTDFPSATSYNKQAFITGQKTGTEIRPTR